MNENLPRKRPKIFLEMAKIYPGNGSGGPGNMPWGPWNIPWISINAKLSLRATKNARDKVVEVICLLHRIWFPDIQGNLSPFLHMFPGRFFWFRGNSSSIWAQGFENHWPFVNWLTMLEARAPRVHLGNRHFRVKNVLLYWIYPYALMSDPVGDEGQKIYQLYMPSYQNRSCSVCFQDVYLT